MAIAATVAPRGFDQLGDDDLVAPPLMWSEARSTLRLQAWHGALSTDDAAVMRERLESAPVASRSPKRLGDEAWGVADEMGWARTYDAEYVALARLLRCRLVTLDARLRRVGDRLGIVVSPTEL